MVRGLRRALCSSRSAGCAGLGSGSQVLAPSSQGSGTVRRCCGVCEGCGVSAKGCGIPSEVAQKIGKVFFTTKPPGQGSGMGLVLSNAIISRFGGTVKLFNLPECGACTEVRLPLAPFVVSGRS